MRASENPHAHEGRERSKNTLQKTEQLAEAACVDAAGSGNWDSYSTLSHPPALPTFKKCHLLHLTHTAQTNPTPIAADRHSHHSPAVSWQASAAILHTALGVRVPPLSLQPSLAFPLPQGLESLETPLTAALDHSAPPMACPCKSRLRESLQPGHSVPSPVNHDNLSTTACQPVILHARPGQRRCVVRHRYLQRQLISSADMCIVAMRKVLISSRDTSPVLRLHHVNGRQIMAAGSWEASPTVQWP